jgi:hypothetical protein
MELTDQDFNHLRRLEESHLRTEVRCSPSKMAEILAKDFFEFGKSGTVYNRAELLAAPLQAIDAVLPLPDLQIRLLSADVAQVTYRTIVRHESSEQHALRSSIWSRTDEGWRLRFHQGTPILPAT